MSLMSRSLLTCNFNHPSSLSPLSSPCIDDDVYYYNRWRLKLEGETENICVCTKERKGVSAEVLRACTSR